MRITSSEQHVLYMVYNKMTTMSLNRAVGVKHNKPDTAVFFVVFYLLSLSKKPRKLLIGFIDFSIAHPYRPLLTNHHHRCRMFFLIHLRYSFHVRWFHPVLNKLRIQEMFPNRLLDPNEFEFVHEGINIESSLLRPAYQGWIEAFDGASTVHLHQEH